MSNVSLHQFLVLYTWFPLVVLLLFMLLIARFYQRFSGERMYFWFYSVVIVLFGIAAVRYASIGVGNEDLFVDILSFIGGTILSFLSILLYKRMITSPSKNS